MGAVLSAARPRSGFGSVTRRESIVWLLGSFGELCGSATTRAETRGSGERVPLPEHDSHCGVWSRLHCDCWRRSFVTLEWELVALAEALPRTYAHLSARFKLGLKARKRNLRLAGGEWQGLAKNQAVLIPDVAGTKGKDRVYADVLVLTWPIWVEKAEVDSALDWLAARSVWDAREPVLPRDAVAA